MNFHVEGHLIAYMIATVHDAFLCSNAARVIDEHPMCCKNERSVVDLKDFIPRLPSRKRHVPPHTRRKTCSIRSNRRRRVISRIRASYIRV